MTKAQTPETPAAPPEDAAEAPQEQQIHGVLVIREFDANGKPMVGLVPQGDCRVTEIPTILKLGLSEFSRAFDL